MNHIWSGPRFYGRFDADGTQRQENVVEWAGEGIMSALRGVYGFAKLFSPALLGYMYTRGYMTQSSLLGLLRLVALATTSAYISRFVGRMMDSEYRDFIKVWQSAKEGSPEARGLLKRFDYCLDGTTPDFVARNNEQLWYLKEESAGNPVSKAIAFFAVHSFGIRMLYPGATGLLNLLLGSALRNARQLQIGSQGHKRAVVQTAKGDLIDTTFKRGSSTVNGGTLVICCEGNAGFYEIGLIGTPSQLGYSVLGWNTPGFAESTGRPYPEQVLAAADAVWQYATEVLHFQEENIVLFGWSIGGFPSTWLAANHPGIRALILDATFDDLVPLAKRKMPKFAAPIVEVAIRNFLNLDHAKQLARYDGPVRLIRRLQEEILITEESGSEEEKRASNRGNELLKRLLEQRHAGLVDGLQPQIDRWLAMSSQERVLSKGLATNATADTIRVSRLFALCESYLVDFDATHVMPLPPNYFNIPTPPRAYLS